MAKIPWGPSVGGGSLKGEEKKKVRNLIDNLGTVLEKECEKNKINKFVFVIFKPFNLLAAVTKSNVILIFSPSTSGMPRQLWQDYTNEDPQTNSSDLLNSVQQQLGWSNISVVEFPSSIVNLDFEAQKPELVHTANQWIDNIVKETEKQARIVRINPIFQGRDFLIEKDLCFILMPFEEPFDTIYKKHIKPTVENKFRIERADNIFKSSVIIEDVWEYINKSQFIIADVTGKNPNVFYELGIAHTVGKEVVIITQNKDDIPFDLKHRRYFVYSNDTSGLQKLRTNLTNVMNELFPKS